uniref:Target of rapamycin complex subunit lst8 n=1 Tax=Anopheles christyi TaxID=43041 RepID=A0A182KFW4_9DIPT
MGVLQLQPILATGGYDRTIRLWQPYTGQCIRTLVHSSSQVNSLAISSTHDLLAAGGYERIRLYDFNRPYPTAQIDFGLHKNVTRVGFQQQGNRWLYTGGEDGKVCLWDINATKRPSCMHIFECQRPVNALCLLPNQVELLIAMQQGGIYLWDIRSDQYDLVSPEADCAVQDVTVSPNGAYMAAITSQGKCFIWTLTAQGTGLTKMESAICLKAHRKYGLRCRFSPDSSLLVTCSGDGTARIYRTDRWMLQAELPIERFWMWDAVFNYNSKYIITASSDCLARLWDIETNRVERLYSGHLKAVTALALRDVSVGSTADTTGKGLSSTH